MTDGLPNRPITALVLPPRPHVGLGSGRSFVARKSPANVPRLFRIASQTSERTVGYREDDRRCADPEPTENATARASDGEAVGTLAGQVARSRDRHSRDGDVRSPELVRVSCCESANPRHRKRDVPNRICVGIARTKRTRLAERRTVDGQVARGLRPAFRAICRQT